MNILWIDENGEIEKKKDLSWGLKYFCKGLPKKN